MSALAYVAHNRDHVFRLTRAVWAQADFNRKKRAVFSLDLELQARPHGAHLWVLGVAGAIASMKGPFICRNQHFDGLADEFVACITKDMFRGLIDQSDPSFSIHLKNGVRRGFKQAAKPILILTQCWVSLG